MKNWKKRLIALFMAIALVVTMFPNSMGVSEVEAAQTVDGTLEFVYRYGTNNLIQVNTNLPSTTPCANFTAGDNDCAIDQTQNQYQQVGWIGMDNVAGTIVLSFHFNSAFEAGQTYKLKHGSVFGFTDGKKYVLNKDYTFTWNGSTWAMEAVAPEETNPLEFGYRWGVDNTLQVNTNLPASTTLKDFTAGDNGCNIDQTGSNQQVGWIQMLDAEGTIVLTFHFNSAFEAGQTYKLKRGSVFGFTDGSKYELDKDYTFSWDGSTWKMETGGTLEFAYRYGAGNVIQVNTDLPSTTPLVNFTAEDNGCEIDQSQNQYQQVGWIGMDNVDGTIVLTFNFNDAFTAGQTYILKKDSLFGFTDGKKYKLDKDYVFTWDGSNWTVSNELPAQIGTLEFAYRYGAGNVIQVNTDLPSTTPLVNFTAEDNGCEIDQSQNQYQQVGWIGMDNVDGTIVLTFHFNSAFEAGQTYILKKDSLFSFTDGKKYKLDKDYIFTWDGSNWTMTHQKEGDANGDYTIDSRDLVRVKKVEAKLMEYTASCDIIVDAVVDHWDTSAMRQILLDTYVRHADAISTAEYLLDPERFNGGGEFVTFADRPADPTNPDKIQEYKAAGFNTATVTGEYGKYQSAYVKATVGEKTYNLLEGERSLELNATGYLTANMFQVATNLPTDGTYGNFLPSQKPAKFEYTTSNGTIGYFEFQAAGEQERKVYLNPHYNDNPLKDGESFTYKAGSKFKVGDTWYVLEADYTVTYCNDYQASIKNLDAAGLNVWIRNTSNKTNYFTGDILNLIQPYTDVIDGIYMGDEPFSTTDIRTSSYSFTKSKNDLELMTFDELCSLNPWFNDNLQDKYFFVNHVGMPGYNHYMKSPQANAPTVSAYAKYYEDYNTSVLSGITSSTKKPLSFDLYPLGYDKREIKQEGLIIKKDVWQPTKWQPKGIDPYYLVTMLTVANKAKEQGNIFSYYIQAQTNKTQLKTGESRALISSEEISMQLYAGMACGAKMYGYYLYNALANEPQNGMIDANGIPTKMYEWVRDANKEALPFADVLQTFEWQGAEFISGKSNNNSEAKSLVGANASDLQLVLTDSTDGVLTNTSAENLTDDILVGYYTKGGQDAYMIANYNDPRYVTNKNNVTLKFDGCNYARVYTGTASGLTSEIVPLAADGSYTFTLKPGGGCFVIPVNAAS